MTPSPTPVNLHAGVGLNVLASVTPALYVSSSGRDNSGFGSGGGNFGSLSFPGRSRSPPARRRSRTRPQGFVGARWLTYQTSG